MSDTVAGVPGSVPESDSLIVHGHRPFEERNMIRNFLIFSALALAANAASAETPCDPATAANSCTDDTTISFCDDTTNPSTPVTGSASCTFPDAQNAPTVPGGTCSTELPCRDTEGDGCTAFGLTSGATCLAGLGDPCLGLSPLLNDDEADDENALGLICGGGNACIIGGSSNAAVEECVSGIPACTTFGISCSGQTLSLCLFGASEDADESGALNGTEDKDGDGVVDAFIITQPVGIDCAAFGGTCSNSATSGPLHDAFPDAAGQALPDCAFPEEPAEGEGEGDGVGNAACTVDADCGRDQKCDNGQCVDAAEDDEKSVSCANAGAMAPAAALLVMVAPLFRRRRRR